MDTEKHKEDTPEVKRATRRFRRVKEVAPPAEILTVDKGMLDVTAIPQMTDEQLRAVALHRGGLVLANDVDLSSLSGVLNLNSMNTATGRLSSDDITSARIRDGVISGARAGVDQHAVDTRDRQMRAQIEREVRQSMERAASTAQARELEAVARRERERVARMDAVPERYLPATMADTELVESVRRFVRREHRAPATFVLYALTIGARSPIFIAEWQLATLCSCVAVRVSDMSGREGGGYQLAIAAVRSGPNPENALGAVIHYMLTL